MRLRERSGRGNSLRVGHSEGGGLVTGFKTELLQPEAGQDIPRFLDRFRPGRGRPFGKSADPGESRGESEVLVGDIYGERAGVGGISASEKFLIGAQGSSPAKLQRPRQFSGLLFS